MLSYATSIFFFWVRNIFKLQHCDARSFSQMRFFWKDFPFSYSWLTYNKNHSRENVLRQCHCGAMASGWESEGPGFDPGGSRQLLTSRLKKISGKTSFNLFTIKTLRNGNPRMPRKFEHNDDSISKSQICLHLKFCNISFLLLGQEF